MIVHQQWAWWGMFTGGAIIDIGIALDPDWPVVSAFDCAMIMLKTVSTTWTSYTKVNIHCGEIKEATYLSLHSNTRQAYRDVRPPISAQVTPLCLCDIGNVTVTVTVSTRRLAQQHGDCGNCSESNFKVHFCKFTLQSPSLHSSWA